MTWKLGRDKVVSLLHAIPVVTVLSFNLVATSSLTQQFPINSVSFYGRDLESVSRLSSGPFYFVFVVVAQT